MSLTKGEKRKLEAKLNRSKNPEKIKRYRKALGLDNPEPVVETAPEPVVEAAPEPVVEAAPVAEEAPAPKPKPKRRIYRRRKTTKTEE
tara:strand:+ start:3131 stop:3394 length:264 start_codon:yes stop_codon:yes gene_type:complete